MAKDPNYSPKQALVLLTQEICGQLDDLARLKKEGAAATLSEHLFRETCSVLPELSADLKEQYLDYLMTFTEVLSLPAESAPKIEPAKQNLSGPSKSLKKAMKAIQKVA